MHDGIKSDCGYCKGTGVLYAQADIDAKDREIDTLNKMCDKLAEKIAEDGAPLMSTCNVCGYYAIIGCIRPSGATCIDGVRAWARQQVEERK